MDAREIRVRLQARQREARQRAAALRAGLAVAETASVDELSSYDNHPAEMSSVTWEREKDLGLLLRAERQEQEVRDALERLAAGTYGICEECGQPIGEARLAARPEAARCLACQTASEAAAGPNRRPVEEDVINDLWPAATDPDDQGPNALDVWSELVRQGSSDTPADLPQMPDYKDPPGPAELADPRRAASRRRSDVPAGATPEGTDRVRP